MHSFAGRLTRRILLLWIPDDAVHGFVGPAEQSDDLTMLAICFMRKS